MTTINPTRPLQELRNNTPARTCHHLGVCLHPSVACTGVCEQAKAMQQLPTTRPLQTMAPGAIEGPYRIGKRHHASRLRIYTAALLVDMAVVAAFVRWVL